MLMGRLFHSGLCNWRYHTEPVPTLEGRSLYWPRGKVLGGSSTINGMVYVRGNRHDYDRWAQMGLPGWSYDEVLPAFRRSEALEFSAGGGLGLFSRRVPLSPAAAPQPDRRCRERRGRSAMQVDPETSPSFAANESAGAVFSTRGAFSCGRVVAPSMNILEFTSNPSRDPGYMCCVIVVEYVAEVRLNELQDYG